MVVCLSEFFLLGLITLFTVISIFIINYFQLKGKENVSEGEGSKSMISTFTDAINKIMYSRNENPTRQYQGQNVFSDYSQMIGYIFGNNMTYPLYAERRDRNFYYYIIDNSRNNVKIPLVKNQKHEEFFDGDTVNIPELGGNFTVKLYEVYGTRYNPYNY